MLVAGESAAAAVAWASAPEEEPASVEEPLAWAPAAMSESAAQVPTAQLWEVMAA
jgi:hypothetical protein